MDADIQSNEMATELRGATIIAIASACIALNVGLGAVVFFFKLPIYADAIGTLTFALIAGGMGWRGCMLAALIGAISFILTALLINPAAIWFIPTQVAIAVYGFYVARPLLRPQGREAGAGPKRFALAIAVGIGLGIIAGIVSAPIIAFVFGGITGSGASFIVAILLKSGEGLYRSVLASGIASEPVDKTLQLLIALAVAGATPTRVIRALSRHAR
jgi:energy-coupling factor transport system substrate-specific component